ncbi:hypothetical protein [Streptomyces sp. NPDC050121]|uniref:hypothetical protein n=1 Tax=Streptomyces sp. NPDC050121 TaxID=3365601 RepID=UPI0037A01F4F
MGGELTPDSQHPDDTAAPRLREDFDASDIVLLRMATAGVVNATGGAAHKAWRCVVALFIQSMDACRPSNRIDLSTSGASLGSRVQQPVAS